MPYQFDTKCRHWCFLPGMGLGFLPQCMLLKDHEEDHRLVVTLNGPPSGEFIITWKLGVGVENA